MGCKTVILCFLFCVSDLKGQHWFTLFTGGGPCHLSSFKQCSGPYFPLTTACLFTCGKNTYFWVCTITSLILETLKFLVWMSFSWKCICLAEIERAIRKETVSKTTLTEVFTHCAPAPFSSFIQADCLCVCVCVCVCVCAALCYSLQRCQSHFGAATHLGQSETVRIDDTQQHLKGKRHPVNIIIFVAAKIHFKFVNLFYFLPLFGWKHSLTVLLLTGSADSCPNTVHGSQNRNEGTTCFWSRGAVNILCIL